MNKNNGFIALISVIVITMILLGVTATLGMKGFLDRFNILEGEAKETSAGLAAACVEAARIKIADEGSTYTGGDTLCLEWPCAGEDDDKKCLVSSVTPDIPHTDESTILTHASYKGASTNYEVVVNYVQELIPIVSWKEI
ncbi:MAG: hypothetical protein A3G58_00775 [Candidatus Colwellbacteria bacterium RIFCSPLOWO2_12_FULL_46_17]|uniref:Uncharacterized protein n=3 Tax=Parcubacteria group TaxID=1794811 RepID=A0A0H4TNZ9_9BACT|nr:hypothetical protein [uncultured Parcubacteria bacterium Rifle_16ft_4_minimus_37647]OGY61668.1 MAG: hypothetical protein A3I33_01100 [Candidatus Colwellbacteria bacterium RIFCSPLOWO2_02_FULL_45_11]OGY62096.1 MAG: hypothetical protein A3G58_00775 [Candidatus Colwellbacteria bacterium RIFCSPLOWO2_12_FULL_46_17]